MPDLIAQGPRSSDRWRRELPADREVVVGRSPGAWQVDWDDRISRIHASLHANESGSVLVERHPAARNPIFYRGQKRDRFTMQPGEHFVIGRTTFTLAVRPLVAESSVADPTVTEQAFASAALRRRLYRDAGNRIEMLSRLPDLITGSTSDSELLVRVTGVLLQATAGATAVAVLRVDSESSGNVQVLHYDSRAPEQAGPRPSGRLARQAIECGESVLHLWGGGRMVSQGCVDQSRPAFTADEGVDWAFCVPIPGEASPGWVLYESGQLPRDAKQSVEQSLEAASNDLQDDLKFAELVATTLGRLRQLRNLQQRQAGLSRFFAPVVMEALGGRDAQDVLRPREADIAVLFCDLRGFSRRSEEQADQLMELLQRVSEALSVMTRRILHWDGVIGDFHGDAAMGFWGWPIAQPDAAGRACRTALEILAEFGREGAAGDGPLSGFRCGIGVATGRAVVGQIGSSDQVKVTAFGPVVNLASRLEGMTKPLSAEILIDEATARYVRETLPRSLARTRRLAPVRPAGMRTPLVVHQLLPPAATPGTIRDADIETYEAALDDLLDRRWDRAFERLHEVSASDRAKDFLTVYIASHGRVPPANWDGVVPLERK
ncbi:adenylate/guanylate cyclase domain-containing protein [Candidatus Laterigemmans baculatus]|uniref:adenylate/guanylate cyclase domain-containing protein n=1 Tax=Candidatus Laterigemmans baculatus TaxID=2770505 RepID=UPI0013DCDE2B|nr:adenylate/guanylate cyclase domain-containing protein [Candidatus Laterigemmans baculatus]